MKKQLIWLYGLMLAAGAAAFYVGQFILTDEPSRAFSGLCIGAGAALFCLGAGNLVGALTISKTDLDKKTRQKNIEARDERNVRIREKVGAKINQVVIYALSAIVLAMGFLRVNVIAILLVSSVFVLEFVLSLVLTDYYSKRI